MLVAAIWHNALQPFNVNGDSLQSVSAIDALTVINELNSRKVSHPQTGALPLELPAGQQQFYVDINCDSHVSAIDALIVINALNSGKIAPAWSFQTTGDAGGSAGNVSVASCSPKLTEGSSYTTQLVQQIVLPNSNSSVRVSFETPTFDTSSRNQIRDAFELIALDESGQPIHLPYDYRRDAAYNWSEDLDPRSGAGSQITTQSPGSISSATLNFSGMSAGTKISLVARLVNNDSDTNTSVVIRRVEVIDSNTVRPIGMSVANSNQSSLTPLDESVLVDFSGSLVPTYGTTTIIAESRTLVSELQLFNASAQAVSGRVVVVISDLSDPSVTVRDPDGFLDDGRAYLLMPSAQSSGWLGAGQSTEKREIRFFNPTGARFTYSLSLLAEVNSPPLPFAANPLREVEAGKPYAAQVSTTDPDGQSLKYALLAAPQGMTIHDTTGRIAWSTSLADLGNHTVIVKASDPFGQSVQFRFTVQVFESVGNRPPIFTSTPDTEAKVSGSFEVLTHRVGKGPVGITAGAFDGVSKVIATVNTDDSNLTIGGQSVRVGEPKPSDRLFEAGRDVDLGFPEFLHPNDRNQLEGFVQGDFNEDGSLDYVASITMVVSNDQSQVRNKFLSVILGDGEGSFHSPQTISVPVPVTDSDHFGTLITGDFNSDGHLDVVGSYSREGTASGEGAPRAIAFLGVGNGSFQTPINTDLQGVAIEHAKAGDFNKDGKLDLAVIFGGSQRAGLHFGNGDGTFGALRPFADYSPSGSGFYVGFATGDLDGNGSLDIVLPDLQRQALYVYANNGQGGMAFQTQLSAREPYSFQGETRPHTTWIADFTSDGIADILYATGRSGNTSVGALGLYKGVGDGRTFTYSDAGRGLQFNPYNLADRNEPLDFDQDGHFDVLLGGDSNSVNNTVGVALGNGDGTFRLSMYILPLSDREQAGTGHYSTNHVFAGDYNRDGLLDIVAAQSGGTSAPATNFSGATILYAETPGVVGAPRALPSTNQLNRVQLPGDVNGDGNVDIVLGDGQRFYTRLGRGDGTFEDLFPATPGYYANDPSFATLVDVDRDSILDLMWTRTQGYQGASQGYMAALGNGDGTFSVTFNLSIPGSFYGGTMIPPADFNGDGYLDFAAEFGGAFSIGTTVDVYLYNPSQRGTFVPSYRYTYPGDQQGPNGNALSTTLSRGDFDNDGLIDLLAIAVRTGSYPHRIELFRGKGDGTFDDPVSAGVPELTNEPGVVEPKWIDVGDIDRDGNLDFVLAATYSTLAVFRGKGNGSFEAPMIYAEGFSWGATRAVVLADFDKDGHLDLSLQFEPGNTRRGFAIRLGNGDGTFGSPQRYYSSSQIGPVNVADFNNDGITDVVTDSNWLSNSTEIYLGNNPGLTDLTTADVNRDGRLDVLALNAHTGHVKLLLGNGDSSFSRQPDILVGRGAMDLESLDINSDGKIDFVTANRGARSVSLLIGNGQGQFVRTDTSIGSLLSSLAVGDWNGDGRADVVVSSESTQALYLLPGSSSGLGTPRVVPTGESPTQIAVGDATGDGRNDVVAVLPGSMRVMILPGTTSGAFGSPLYVSLDQTPGDVGLADFNLDGQLDLAITLPEVDQAAILFARGNGRFAVPQTLHVGAHPESLSIEDINQDGRDDILVANRDDNTATVILNRFDPTNLYRYQAVAVDPDNDPVTYRLTEAPGGMILNEDTGAIAWAPTADQIGLQSITIVAEDPRGGRASQSFRVEVVPNRENSVPIISSIPNPTVDAASAFKYKPSTIDADGDPLRYRLLNAPSGASIDPTSGEIQWDARLGGLEINRYRSGSGQISIPHSPTLQAPSLTVEASFRFNSSQDNQALILKSYYKPFVSDHTFRLTYNYGTLRATIAGTDANNNISDVDLHFPWRPIVGQWYHLAMTFDDSTSTLSLLIDGQVVGSIVTGRRLAFDGNPIIVGDEYFNPMIGSISGLRIWNVAKSAAQIRADLARDMASDTPGLLLDYRFQDDDSVTVRDHSAMKNHGKRNGGRLSTPQPIQGLASQQIRQFLLQVEDGRGGIATQAFEVAVVPQQTSNLQGTVFLDANENGVQDGTEKGIEDAIVFLDTNENEIRDPEERFARTNRSGSYHIDQLHQGAYSVRLEPRAGLIAPASSSLLIDPFQNAQINLPLHAQPKGQIAGTVRIDTNSNGSPSDSFVVYQSDFESPGVDLSMWSQPKVVTTPNGKRLLGEFFNESISLELRDSTPIPMHGSLTYTFDLALLRNWEGNNQVAPNVVPELIFEANGIELFRTTFSNFQHIRQAYPDSYPGGSNQGRTGAIATDSFGQKDSTFRLTFTIEHFDPASKFTIRAANMPHGIQHSAFAIVSAKVTATEPMARQWTVFLDANGNKVLDPDERTTLTDSRGNYALVGMSEGSYSVLLDQPNGWATTSPILGEHQILLGPQSISEGKDFLIRASSASSSQPRFLTQPIDRATARTEYRYASRALDPGYRPIRYSLASGPEGMVVDPQQGTILWTPSLSQVGEHQVVLKVVNDLGSAALQTVLLTVDSPNTAPVITSTPLSIAAVDKVFLYDLHAQDAEQDLLEYRLLQGPGGSNLDSSGRFAWTPTAAQMGSQTIQLEVLDGQGGRAVQAFQLDVVAQRTNRSPQITTVSRTPIAVGVPLYAQVEATDPDQDPLSFELLAGPAGMALSSSGFLSWTANTQQIGPHRLTIRAFDNLGGSATLEQEIEVSSNLENRSPQIQSTPVLFAVSGKLYQYDLHTSDEDGDVISYEILEGPSGISISPERGTIRWAPAKDQTGQFKVSVRASDPYGGSDTQSYTLSARTVGGPPAILSTPSTRASVGVAYLYSVSAFDAESDPLTYALLQGPSGMSIHAITGELAWTPSPGQVGAHQVILQASDGVGGFSTQAFTVQVEVGTANQPPQLLDAAPLYATVGTLLTYPFLATDPEGSMVSYSVRRGPVGMQVNSSTGLVTWTPTAADVGRQIVALVATDEQGAAAVLSFELDVLSANRNPVISSNPPTKATAYGEYRYNLLAKDEDLDPLAYSLIEHPPGMSIDEFGRLRWQTTPADIGVHTARVRVADPRGGFAEQSILVNVVADTQAPRVTIIAGQTIVRANSPEVFTQFQLTPFYPTNTVRVSAVDDVGVTSILVTANGKPVMIDANGNANFRFEDWGFGTVTVVGKATDRSGNVGSSSQGFAFLPYGDDPSVSQLANPEAVITSPGQSDSVLGMVEIRGSASSDNFTKYILTVRRSDSANSTLLATSSTKVNAGILGRWDTTLLENDEYTLRLEVHDDIFGMTVFEQSVGVYGEYKLGNFRLSFADLTIPVAGIPITLARTYDTLRADRPGEFGFGWRMEFRDTDLRTSLPKSGLEAYGIYTAFKSGTKVYLTLPGGVREGYTFTPEIRALPGFGGGLLLAKPKFTPDRGVKNSLLVGDGYLIVNSAGELISAGGVPWNPASPDFGGGYTLKQPDGTSYRIDGNSGELQSVTDRHGNALTFDESGVLGPGGVRLTFERDTRGRIVRVTDPAGKSLRYAYDAKGDLKSVTDREDNLTQLFYRSDRAHFLDRIVDPLGRVGVRNVYDASGRLVSEQGADGKLNLITYDPDNEIVSVRNSLGQVEVHEYDERGNIVRQTDAKGAVTRRTYDEDNNVLSMTSAVGETTRYRYNPDGKIVSRIDAGGRSSIYTFGIHNVMTSFTDPLGNTTQYELDGQGNVVATLDPLGRRTEAAYNPQGLITQRVDALGASTSFAYNPSGLLVSQTDSLGVLTTYTHALTGEVSSSSRRRTTPAGQVSVTQSATYNANGDLLSLRDANGNVFSNQIDDVGNIIAGIDPLGRTTSSTYDASGSIIATQFPDGTSLQILRDSEDNPTKVTNRNGTEVTFGLDATGRITSSTSNGSTLRYETDAVGRLTRALDSLGRSTQMRFDSPGQPATSITNAANQQVETEYDAAMRPIMVKDAMGQTVHYQYDAVGNITSVKYSDGRRASYQYDALNRLVAQTDELGRTTRLRYDSLGRLLSISSPQGETTEYAYDEMGNILSERNAAGMITRFEYDNLGQVTSIILPSGKKATFGYDAARRLVSSTNFENQTTQWDYDNNDLVIRKTVSGGTNIEIVRDNGGMPIRVTDPRGVTHSTYDSQQNLLTRTDAGGAAVEYAYDNAQRLTSIQTSEGKTSYQYDVLNRISQVTDSRGNVTRYAYDAAGNLVETQLPNGIVETKTYDARNWLASVTQVRGGQTLSSYSYSRLENGQINQVVESNGTTTRMEYDDSGRLTKEAISGPSITARSIEYRYDSVGNRTAKIDSLRGTTLYGYDSQSRLATEQTPTTLIRYSYDENGNRIARDAGGEGKTTYRWSAEGRLMGVSMTIGASTTEIEYAYDMAGNLVSRSVNGVETRYLIDSTGSMPRILREYRPDGTSLAEYVYGVGLISQTLGGSQQFLLSDGESGVRMTTNSAGVAIGNFAFDAYGNRIDSGSASSQFLFNGEFRDPITGLDFLRSRHYDPRVGQFISRDMASIPRSNWQDRNRYLYAAGDPVNRIDPSGQLSLVEVQTAMQLVGMFAAAVAATNLVQYAFAGSNIHWNGSIFTGSVGLWSPLIGGGGGDVRVETRNPIPVDGDNKNLQFFNARYFIGEAILGVDFFRSAGRFQYSSVSTPMGASAGNDQMRLASPKLFGVTDTVMQGLVLRAGAGAGLIQTSVGLNAIRLGWGVGWTYSNPFDIEPNLGKPVSGLPEASGIQLEFGFEATVGISLSIADAVPRYHKKPYLD